jgi:NAD(P)-dependent dehydrogenase (short-subunit alcohol dehydrogenase family)
MPPIPIYTKKYPPLAAFTAGNNALITGGASGIGFAIAKLCLSKGLKVHIADLNGEALDTAKQELAKEHPDSVSIYELDVGKEEDWKKLHHDVGKVDVLFLNAGTSGKGSWGDTEYFQKVSLTELSLDDVKMQICWSCESLRI